MISCINCNDLKYYLAIWNYRDLPGKQYYYQNKNFFTAFPAQIYLKAERETERERERERERDYMMKYIPVQRFDHYSCLYHGIHFWENVASMEATHEWENCDFIEIKEVIAPRILISWKHYYENKSSNNVKSSKNCNFSIYNSSEKLISVIRKPLNFF